MTEEKKKTAEEKAKEKTIQQLLFMIAGKTYSRHANMSEEEFINAIGFKDMGMDEDHAIRLASANMINGLTIALFNLKEQVKMLKGFIVMLSGKTEEDLLEEYKKENGEKE